MIGSAKLLLRALTHPESMLSLPLSSWDLLIRQARSTGLLANLYDAARNLGQLDSIPDRPRKHLEAARILTDKHQRDVRWEVRCIADALAGLEQPIVLLKGAAYLLGDLPIAKPRLFSDIDILVPKDTIELAEQTLRLKGWMVSAHDAYDQRYYRQWMHELPPLRHSTRHTTLDVHHNILPETARLHPDPNKLLQAAIPLAGHDRLHVLAPVDMVLHSATHLFHEGEFTQGLRDLVDLDGLLRHFGSTHDFWNLLPARAKELELQRPLYYALRYCRMILATPVPEDTVHASEAAGPAGLMPALMDQLFLRALVPDHASCRDGASGMARRSLYIRAHYLRMPPHLLVPHLFHKAFVSTKK